MQTCGLIIYPREQPGKTILGCCERHGVLQHVVEVGEPPPVMVEHCDRPAAVNVRQELLLRLLLRLHRLLQIIGMPVLPAYLSTEQRPFHEKGSVLYFEAHNKDDCWRKS